MLHKVYLLLWGSKCPALARGYTHPNPAATISNSRPRRVGNWCLGDVPNPGGCIPCTTYTVEAREYRWVFVPKPAVGSRQKPSGSPYHLKASSPQCRRGVDEGMGVGFRVWTGSGARTPHKQASPWPLPTDLKIQRQASLSSCQAHKSIHPVTSNSYTMSHNGASKPFSKICNEAFVMVCNDMSQSHERTMAYAGCTTKICTKCAEENFVQPLGGRGAWGGGLPPNSAQLLSGTLWVPLAAFKLPKTCEFSGSCLLPCNPAAGCDTITAAHC